MKAIIFDTDGTVADCSHRVHHVKNGNHAWDAFFAGMDQDTVIEPVADIARAFYGREGYAVIVVTARPADEQYKRMTEAWYANNNIPYDRMYMRKAGDYRKDAVVKAEILEQIIEDGYEPILAIDDRQQVIDMWRSYGICTLACAAPDENTSKYAGKALLSMMIGSAGSGKSTYIKSNFKPSEVISTDQIRLDLFGSFTDEKVHTPENHAIVFGYAHDHITARLKNGLRTVFDATNLRGKDRKAVLGCVPHGQLVEYIVIDREYDQKLKTREWRPEWLVHKHHNTFKDNLKNILAGDHQPNVIVLDKREHKI